MALATVVVVGTSAPRAIKCHDPLRIRALDRRVENVGVAVLLAFFRTIAGFEGHQYLAQQLAARLVAGVVMLDGGVLLLRRRVVGRPVLATGGGLALLTIVAIALGVIKMASRSSGAVAPARRPSCASAGPTPVKRIMFV